ncbi:hypothetical protein C0J52_02452 [Blattella germanica]|nr:hypothetical protein C0J52_02452 [Blattella germanica]
MQIKIAAVEAFLQTGSVIASQRALRRNNQDRHEPVPERHSIMRWVRQWRNFGNVQNINSPGRRTSKRTPENAVRVRTAFQQSPRRSARRHALTLRLSPRSLGRLLTDIKFHPYTPTRVHLVSTGWGDSTHCTPKFSCPARSVSKSINFPLRRFDLAVPIPGFNGSRLFSVGIS